MPKYELQYRDASNYKWNITAELKDILKPGDEITIERIGYSPETFLPEFCGDYWDPAVDHNILEVVQVLPDNYEVQVPICKE